MPEKSIEAAEILTSIAIACVTILWGILTKRVIDIGKEFRSAEDCRNTHNQLTTSMTQLQTSIKADMKEDREFYSKKMEDGLTRIHSRLDEHLGQNRKDRDDG